MKKTKQTNQPILLLFILMFVEDLLGQFALSELLAQVTSLKQMGVLHEVCMYVTELCGSQKL